MVEKLQLEIVSHGGDWVLVENGDAGTMTYTTREAAFEAVAGSMSNALKEGLEVTLRIAAVPDRTLE